MIRSLIIIILFFSRLYGAEVWKESEQLTTWYDKYDLCIINSSMNTSERVMDECLLYQDDISRTKPIRCRAGNTWPARAAFCSPEDLTFKERTGFKKSLPEYDDPSQKPLESFFRKIAGKKGALLIVGDSVMQQFFSAIACELEREKIWTDPSRFKNTDELQHVKVKGIDHSVEIKFLPIYHFVNGRWDRIPNAAMHNLKKTINQMLQDFDSLVIMLNMGLHFVDNPVPNFSKLDYQKQMTDVLTYLNELSTSKKGEKDIKVFFRETSAQHFPTPNGYWPGVKYSNTMRLACTPIEDPSPSADWRNRIIEQIVYGQGLNTIKIVPFYNLTVPLWTQHPNGHLKDCTHFCWSPMLYQSVFHFMDKSIA